MATQKAVPTPKIFVSSTFSDMKPYRDAIRSAVERLTIKSQSPKQEKL